MNIADYIPVGSENAITRQELVRLTGMPDRLIRIQIEKLRCENAVINNGKGYFYPSVDDKLELAQYIQSQENKAKSIFKNLKYAKALYEDMRKGLVS